MQRRALRPRHRQQAGAGAAPHLGKRIGLHERALLATPRSEHPAAPASSRPPSSSGCRRRCRTHFWNHDARSACMATRDARSTMNGKPKVTYPAWLRDRTYGCCGVTGARSASSRSAAWTPGLAGVVGAGPCRQVAPAADVATPGVRHLARRHAPVLRREPLVPGDEERLSGWSGPRLAATGAARPSVWTAGGIGTRTDRASEAGHRAPRSPVSCQRCGHRRERSSVAGGT